MKKVQVTITRDTVADDADVFIGDVLVVDEDEARLLVALGKATTVAGSPSSKCSSAEKEPRTDEPAVRPAVESVAERAPARRGRPRKRDD